MDNDIDQFIQAAATPDRTTIRRYSGATVAHPVFGSGIISKIELRDLPDGPLFRVQFTEGGPRDFNLDSFREGYFESIALPETPFSDEAPEASPDEFQVVEDDD